MTAAPLGCLDESALRVLLVDDHDLLAQPLALALGFQGLVAEVAPLETREAVVAAAERLRADLVLLDLDLGGAIGDGVGLVPQLTALGSRVLIVTASDDACAVGNALALGAIGVVRKHQSFRGLVDVIVAVAHGRSVMGMQERRDLIQLARRQRRQAAEANKPFDRLSAREAQALRFLADGHSVCDIAREWVVSEATVRTHVRGILTKLGVGSQLAAVAMARRAGWLTTAHAG